MGENFVPEMHDIEKLINSDAIQAALEAPIFGPEATEVLKP